MPSVRSIHETLTWWLVRIRICLPMRKRTFRNKFSKILTILSHHLRFSNNKSNRQISAPGKMVTENIVCDGDLILAVGEAQVRLRASANVLLRSSTVFGALLGPHFREGQHAGTAEQPKEIRLHEDDAAAMSDMLNLLHNNPVKGLLLNPTANKILALAVVVDKYDCVEALGLEIQGILLAFPIVRKDLTFAEIVKNLLASYLLKHSWAFKELCGRAIVQSQEPFVTLREEEWAKLFPSNLICTTSMSFSPIILSLS